jgi:quinol monooxygenase YgiN
MFMSDVYVVATSRAKQGSTAALRAVLESLIAPTRLEDGCLSYNLYAGEDDSFLFFEHWASPAALDAHSKTPRFLKTIGEAQQLTDGAMDVKVLKTLG